ncbi:MAG TPA: hypothetical protein VGC66_00735 [Pyrinomonadaceae bacterium]|jgi:hypothetical protein
MNGRLLNIDETLNAVCGAISGAENELREQIKLYYNDANEEFITFAFYSHIKHKLSEATQNKLIEKAFLKDLKVALRHQRYSERTIDREIERQLSRHAAGLVADIVLHNRSQEGKTGGDFGLVIVHPEIKTNSDSLVIKKGASSGLLCQAKIRRKSGRWGDLSNQRDVLPAHLDFASLVLYSYLDGERSELNPVAWKLCNGMTLPELEQLLKKDVFGETLMTVDVVRRLGRSEIGTNDQAMIDKIISPSARQHLEIRIYWPKGDTPGGPVEIKVRKNQVVRQKVSVLVRRT